MFRIMHIREDVSQKVRILWEESILFLNLDGTNLFF